MFSLDVQIFLMIDPWYPLPIVLIFHQFTSGDTNSDQSIHRKVKYHEKQSVMSIEAMHVNIEDI